MNALGRWRRWCRWCRSLSERPKVVAGLALALAALLLTTGTLHFVAAKGFESIVPRFVGAPRLWVYLSGVAELGCAVLLITRSTRRGAGWACVVLFLIVFPANIAEAVDATGAANQAIAWLRLPLQLPLIVWALVIATEPRGPAL